MDPSKRGRSQDDLNDAEKRLRMTLDRIGDTYSPRCMLTFLHHSPNLAYPGVVEGADLVLPEEGGEAVHLGAGGRSLLREL